VIGKVHSYTLVNGQTITGVIEKTCNYLMGGYEHPPVATEFVTPVLLHSSPDGELIRVFTEKENYPTVQVFMQHVIGKAMIYEGEIHEGQTDEAPDSGAAGLIVVGEQEADAS